MPRKPAAEAQQAQSTAGANAAQYGQNAQQDYGQLLGQAGSLINSKGYDPATLSAINNASIGGVNSAFGDATGQIKRNAAVTGNNAGVGANLDAAAMDKGIAGGEAAGGVQIQNANFQNQQRMSGLNLLNSMYGQNVNAQTGNEGVQTGDINAQTNASPGWVQNLTGILGATAGAAGQAGAAAIKGCWIAAKIFGGWDAPETNMVRDWIFNVWAKTWLGGIVSKLYTKYGERLSQYPVVVNLLKPLFLRALKEAQSGRL
jgi:hypothetical protein